MEKCFLHLLQKNLKDLPCFPYLITEAVEKQIGHLYFFICPILTYFMLSLQVDKSFLPTSLWTVSNKGRKNIEIVAETVGVLGDYNLKITPHPRSKFHVFDEKYTDLVLKNRSLYLCNPKQAAVLSFKSKFVFELHKYFQENKFTFIEPPILTEMLLYDDKTAFHFDYEGNKVWLSQCCTFQLEAAILAFEKVYSITPSFRSEHSRSDRHLNEYTHLKVEVAWSNLNDLSELAENILYSIAIRMNEVGKKELKILGASLHPDDYKP